VVAGGDFKGFMGKLARRSWRTNGGHRLSSNFGVIHLEIKDRR
jgi:hypothetical protein